MNITDRANPGASLGNRLWYHLCCTLCRTFLTLVYGVRIWGGRNVPDAGPLLVISNHQSHYDPVLVGAALTNRHLNFMARSGLFNVPGFEKLIRSLNAHPIRQGEPDTAAIRLLIEQLKLGRAVLVFPEGSRTPDGAMHPFKRGVWLLLNRSKATILPVAIDGVYDAFPRKAAFPKLVGQRVGVNIGEPIPAATLLAMGEDKGLRLLERTIETLRVDLADRLTSGGAKLTSEPFSAVVVD